MLAQAVTIKAIILFVLAQVYVIIITQASMWLLQSQWSGLTTGRQNIEQREQTALGN
jgi:hypothetical protein